MTFSFVSGGVLHLTVIHEFRGNGIGNPTMGPASYIRRDITKRARIHNNIFGIARVLGRFHVGKPSWPSLFGPTQVPAVPWHGITVMGLPSVVIISGHLGCIPGHHRRIRSGQMRQRMRFTGGILGISPGIMRWIEVMSMAYRRIGTMRMLVYIRFHGEGGEVLYSGRIALRFVLQQVQITEEISRAKQAYQS